VLGVTAILLAALWALAQLRGGEEPVAIEPAAPAETLEPEPEPEPEPAEQPIPAGEPLRVEIPAIGVDAELVELGLEPNRDMEVPDFGLAGWYTKGPRPGHPGPSLIAAHVDSRAGPDVFHRLHELESGDEVHVHYDTEDSVTFYVRDSEQAPKDDLPGDRIWPVTEERLLTLVTCGGDFDRGRRSYRDNIIVYTTLERPT
jgi:LPXTG-site transpeptidase (sortase) family protein